MIDNLIQEKNNPQIFLIIFSMFYFENCYTHRKGGIIKKGDAGDEKVRVLEMKKILKRRQDGA